jgi:hypothetical protein
VCCTDSDLWLRFGVGVGCSRPLRRPPRPERNLPRSWRHRPCAESCVGEWDCGARVLTERNRKDLWAVRWVSSGTRQCNDATLSLAAGQPRREPTRTSFDPLDRWQGGWDSWTFESQTATMVCSPTVAYRESCCVGPAPRRNHLTTNATTQDYVLDQFPEDRVVLGSDWPVCEGACPGSHAKYVAATKKYVVEKRGLDAAKKLLSENAIRVYRL